MILQYFKKKENEYKDVADRIYLIILHKSKKLIKKNYFEEVNFNSSFELISILLIFYLNRNKEKNYNNYKKINDELVKNFINDLDKTIREIGIGDMSIGKYVKKFYYRIKIIDPILKNFSDRDFIVFLKSLKFVDKKNTKKMANDLLGIYQEIKNKSLI